MNRFAEQESANGVVFHLRITSSDAEAMILYLKTYNCGSQHLLLSLLKEPEKPVFGPTSLPLSLSSADTFSMQLEIQVALNFIISYLYNKLPRRRVNIFGDELERQLLGKYEGHWYPEKPFRGSGFRCIHVGEKVDPVIEEAARESGLDINDVRSNMPQDLSVWIDPFEVSYQIGEKGAVKVLYMEENSSELDKEIRNSFNPEAQVFMPISDSLGASSESSSPSPPPFPQPSSGSPSFAPRSAQPITFTTASFAATKFGSTKIKNGARSANKLSRSSPTNLNISNLLKSRSSSMHSLLSLKAPSALSPNAKEFVFPSVQALGGSGASTAFSSEDTEQFSNPFDMFAAYGERSLVDGLNYTLGNLQYSNQQFQPVMAS
ncbi:hypothetical protein DNTS_016187 [Danionella cerebrum]|uniref:Anti-proliferative protein domain-containing protein n=1 Tax=Danionella cerebrum TaxID=2873325 RepID=A0A553Q516_9TELE|nr:hypothetical protein DNTS_016187 [Danionella translucida]